MFGVFPIATPQFGDAINVPGSRTKRYRKELSIPCNARTCSASFGLDVDLYTFQDAGYFNATAISVLVNCPDGYECPPGSFPKVYTYPRGTFFVPPALPCSTFPIVLQLNGCSSPINRTVACGATAAQIRAAANEVIAEAAAQQAQCDALEDPDIHPRP